MIYPLYSAAQLREVSPTVLDGVSMAKLQRLRWCAVGLIQGAGAELKLPKWVTATAAIYFHWFYAERSMIRNNRFVVAMACLYLASKVLDRPRSIRDIITACFVRRFGLGSPDYLKLRASGFLESVKEQVLEAERIVLMIMGFNFDAVGLPFAPAATFLSHVPWEGLEEHKTDVYRLVWKFINDSFAIPLCMEFSASAIALAVITLAGKHLGIGMETGDFWDAIQEGEIVEERIHNELRGLYRRGEGGMWGPDVQDLQSQRRAADSSQLHTDNASGMQHTPEASIHQPDHHMDLEGIQDAETGTRSEGAMANGSAGMGDQNEGHVNGGMDVDSGEDGNEYRLENGYIGNGSRSQEVGEYASEDSSGGSGAAPSNNENVNIMDDSMQPYE